MRVNLPTSPTFDRQKRLEREGFIQGYHAIVDAKKTDNGITVLCNMRLKRHSQMLMDDFMQAIQSIDEITECYNTSGEYDFTLKIQTRDMDTYQEFMRTKLGNIDSVSYFHSVFVMKEVKNTHGVPSEKPVRLFCSVCDLHYLCTQKLKLSRITDTFK